MHAFENLVATLLEHDRCWVKCGFKVQLTKPEKESIGRPSSARWELDLLGYDAKNNTVLAIECKSFLYSRGVKYKALIGRLKDEAKLYKLFNQPDLRQVVFSRLKKQLVRDGLCPRSPSVVLCLAAGHIASAKDREKLRDHFKQQHWRLFDEAWIRRRLERLADARLENDDLCVVARLLKTIPLTDSEDSGVN